MSRTNLSSVVSRQIPEFIREDYPTFVAFVEAYYEYLQAQGVDLSAVKDIDKTLDKFIVEFKKELAHQLPQIQGDERFLLAHIKDQYLAKGSEASYKLLFRLLFGKKVQLLYPGTQMLRASDGRWNQEISVFAHVDFGDPLEIVGKLVDIQTENRLIRVLVDRKEDLVGEIDRIVALGGDIYEFFLDKRFFGVLNPGNRIKFQESFQATILPATQTAKIIQPGKNFRVGQVFEVISGTGTGALLKVTGVDDNNGIKYAEFIKFGLGYTTDFSVSILSSNTVNAAALVSLAASTSRSGIPLAEGGTGSIVQTIGDVTGGFEEQGYINSVDYFVNEFVNGTYAGSVLREFSQKSANAAVLFDDPSVIQVDLGALVRYPGYYTSNAGFLDDSIFIQDSRYYQAFSYVIKLDERLSSYKSAVKTMLHPAGMALFAEFDITNNIDLSVQLESLVKSLGIGLEDDFTVLANNGVIFTIEKVVSDTLSTPSDSNFTLATDKALTDSLSTPTESFVQLFTKSLTDTYSGMSDSGGTTVAFAKALTDIYSGMSDSLTSRDVSKALTDTSTISESFIQSLNKQADTDTLAPQNHTGYVQLNSYYGQDYVVFAETYSVGSRESTFNTL